MRRNLSTSSSAALLAAALLAAAGCNSNPGGLSDEEYNRLPAGERARLRIEQDKADERQREDLARDMDRADESRRRDRRDRDAELSREATEMYNDEQDD